MNGYKIIVKTYQDGKAITKDKMITSSVCWDELILDFCDLLNNIEVPHNFFIPTQDVKEMLHTISNERLEAFVNSLTNEGEIDV